MAVEDPPRLRDELGGEFSELRRGLSELSEKRPSPATLARIAAAVEVGASPMEPREPLESAASSTATAGKLAAAGAVAIGTAALVFWALKPAAQAPAPPDRPAVVASGSSAGPAGAARALPSVTDQQAPGSTRRSVTDEPPVAAEPGSVEPPPVEPLPPRPSAVAPSAEPLPEARSADARGAPASPLTPVSPSVASQGGAPPRPGVAPKSPDVSTAAPTRPPVAARGTETEILRDARLILDRNPQIALSLSEEHRKEYPNGKLTQERELIAITALVRLGRTGDAEARAGRFRTNFPGSPYLVRLDRLVPP